MKLFYLPRSVLTHRDRQKGGWRIGGSSAKQREPFPLLILYLPCMYSPTPTRPLPPAAFQQSFPEILETARNAEGEEGSRAPDGGEKRTIAHHPRALSLASLFSGF